MHRRAKRDSVIGGFRQFLSRCSHPRGCPVDKLFQDISRSKPTRCRVPLGTLVRLSSGLGPTQPVDECAKDLNEAADNVSFVELPGKSLVPRNCRLESVGITRSHRHTFKRADQIEPRRDRRSHIPRWRRY